MPIPYLHGEAFHMFIEVLSAYSLFEASVTIWNDHRNHFQTVLRCSKNLDKINSSGYPYQT
jgi:hypothetical protein